jgi:hypothetical protein
MVKLLKSAERKRSAMTTTSWSGGAAARGVDVTGLEYRGDHLLVEFEYFQSRLLS